MYSGKIWLFPISGWIKVQLDSGLIDFYHYSNSDQEVVKVVTSPRQLRKDQLIDCGISVCDLGNNSLHKLIYTNSPCLCCHSFCDLGNNSLHKLTMFMLSFIL